MKGILFSPPMVQAILDGRKKQTRRLIKPQPDARGLRTTNVLFEDYHGTEIRPRFNVGDIMYVRETWAECCDEYGSPIIAYKTGNPRYIFKDERGEYIGAECTEKWSIESYPAGGKWKPSLFMPKWASRIFLKVTNVRVERLHDVSEGDAIAEGIELVERNNGSSYTARVKNDYFHGTAKQAFQSLWVSINKLESWNENPYVFAYTFERIEKP